MAELTPEQRWKIRLSQQEANRRAMELIAKEHPLPLPPPRKPNGNGEHRAVSSESTHPHSPLDELPAGEPTALELDPPTYLRWPALVDLEPPERVWLVENWLTSGATLLAGKGGAGKSLLAQTLATALATGKPYLGPVGQPRTVLHWACEDDEDEIWRRQLAVNEYLGTDLTGLERYHCETRVGLDNTLLAPVYGHATPTPLLGRLREQVSDLKAELLILDNAGQCFGANENSRHDVTVFVNLLAGLARQLEGHPFAALILSHPAKASGSEYTGSTAWENAVRMRWYLGATLPDMPEPTEGAEVDPAARVLAKRKANYAAADVLRLTYDRGVLRPEATPTISAGLYTPARQLEDAKQAVMFAVQKAAEVGMRVVRGRNSTASLLKWMRELNYGTGIRDSMIEKALTQLMADGRIVTDVVGRNERRQPLEGLLPKGHQWRTDVALEDTPVPEDEGK